LVEGEEDCAEVGFGSFGGIRLEVGLDVDDEGGADRGEQTGLGTRSTFCGDNWNAETHKNQGGVEVLIVLRHIFGIVLCRLSLVHGVEIDLGVVVLDWLEVHAQRLLDAW
jgi:hypothetical protein